MTAEESASTASDRSLARAIRAWGGHDPARFTSRFSSTWRDRLAADRAATSREKPDAAWAALRADHEGSARPDPSRVHPTWFVRALAGESPAVRLAVIANAPAPLAEALRVGFGLDLSELAPDRAPDPEAIGWALALWAERIVGDVPRLDDDPPVVLALSRLAPRELARLVKACGLAKHAFAPPGHGPSPFDESLARFTSLDRVRLGFFRRHVGTPDPRLVPQAKADLGAIEGDRRRAHARVGLLTFGRLLAAVEPHRGRWALQHLPYPIARRLRVKPVPGLPAKAVLAWESWVMEAAWARLLAEGWLTGERKGFPPAGEGARP